MAKVDDQFKSLDIGEQLIVKRLQRDIYSIEFPDGTTLIGGAASTAISLPRVLFLHEATSSITDSIFRD